jgi:hypothetical protein
VIGTSTAADARRGWKVPSRFPCPALPRAATRPLQLPTPCCEHRPEALHGAGPQVKLRPSDFKKKKQHDFACVMIDACQKIPLAAGRVGKRSPHAFPTPIRGSGTEMSSAVLFLFSPFVFRCPLHPTSILFSWWQHVTPSLNKRGPLTWFAGRSMSLLPSPRGNCRPKSSIAVTATW